MGYSNEPTFTRHERSDGKITSVVLHLCAERLETRTAEDFDPRGSAVMLSPHLAITAAHVFTDTMERYGTDGDNALFRLWGVLAVGDGSAGIRFGVREATVVERTDLAILRLVPWSDIPPAYTWQMPRFRLKPPSIGERVSAFGYFQPHAELVRNGGMGEVAISRSLATSVGEVLEIYPNGRDRVMAPFPCFTTNALYEGSMSGAPVFTDDGHIVGIISAGMRGVDGEAHHGTVALLWPMLATMIKAQLDDDAIARMYAIHQLCERGVLSNVNGWHRVSLTYNETHAVGMVFAHGVPSRQFSESEIRERAYFLWKARGRRDGTELNDWRDAERELGPSS